MSPEEVVRRSLDSWNAGDRAGHRATLADDAIVKEFGTGREIVGADAIVEAHFGWREAFPDMHGEMDAQVSAEDRLVYETVWVGTQTGPLATPSGETIPPTGKRVAVPACMVCTIRGGLIAEQHHYFDLMTLLTQLGVAPAAS